MANETLLFNRDPLNSLLASDWSLGGLPLYGEDFLSIQNNSTEFYGILSLLKGTACILRGCLIDDLNIAAGTCSITEGIVLLKDTVYFIEAQTLNYPFAITKGAETVDTRVFKDSSTKDVAISYTYNIQTIFTFPGGEGINSEFPDNIDYSEAIYFNPFTHQKSEYILRNRSNGLQEVRMLANNITNITKTETGKSIVGGALSAIYPLAIEELSSGGLRYISKLRWKYLGYYNLNKAGFKAIEYNSLFISEPVTIGSNEITLNSNQIPSHTHPVQLGVSLTVSKAVGPNGSSAGFQSSSVDGTAAASISGIINGNTNSNNPFGASQIDITGSHIRVSHIFWDGFKGNLQRLNYYGDNKTYYSNM